VSVQADGIILPVFKKPADPAAKESGKGKAKAEKADSAASVLWPDDLSAALLKELRALATEEKFDAGAGKLLTLRASSGNGLKARRLILLGLGEADKLKPRHWELHLQKALGAFLSLRDPHAVAIALPADAKGLSADIALSLAVDAVYQATYKSMEAKDPPTDLQTAILITPDAKAAGVDEAAIRRAETLAQARSLVKDLVNHPANLKSTRTLSDLAETIGKSPQVQVSVESDPKWIAKNMPCFYTVARGSLAADPPRFITLRYAPKSGKAAKHVAVVGKSVIFDTGGYQVKPGDSMVTMKGDMTGGAVALAVIKALAELKPEHIEVSAYLAATPNKIDSDAMLPDSIVDTTCGKKVEIRHTDAEGRLTLIDAVAKAVENKPDEIITIATLTGAAMVAVGHCVALMGSDESFRERVTAAGRLLGEPIQTLDVLEEDFDNIKSKLDAADIINTSQRKQRGAQTAAAFVMSGAPESFPLVHLDIAGADMTPDEKATGTSVKTVLQYLLEENERLAAEAGAGPAKSAAGKRKKG
jgi:leucyl aminopeptidase